MLSLKPWICRKPGLAGSCLQTLLCYSLLTANPITSLVKIWIVDDNIACASMWNENLVLFIAHQAYRVWYGFTQKLPGILCGGTSVALFSCAAGEALGKQLISSLLLSSPFLTVSVSSLTRSPFAFPHHHLLFKLLGTQFMCLSFTQAMPAPPYDKFLGL